MDLSRRQLLLLGAATLLPRLSPSATRDEMIVLSPQPLDREMPLSGFADAITPVEHFFVRSHDLIPDVKESAWSLRLDGLVEKPATLSLADLRAMPRVELVAVLECAGNGRAFYEPHLPGAQWKFGSVGNARWAGVRLRDVLEKVGVKSGATELLMDGADVPMGKMPDFERTITLEKSMHPDTMLAYEMNGRPLTREHGFPLRMIVPGWAGDSWVKWLQHIEVLDHQFDGFWMKTAYRHPNHSVAPGSVVDPKDMVPVTDLNVKSAIASPVLWAKPGRVTVQGVAWSNASPVTKVEISTDGGDTWKLARLVGTPEKYGFRMWSYGWRAKSGSYQLMSRASNAAGQTQPLQEEWNPSGYLWNVSQKMPVQIGGQMPAPTPTDVAAVAPQPDGYRQACFACHDEHMMRQQHLTRAQWDREVTKMTNWGANVPAESREAILNYLSGAFKQ